MGTGLFMPSHPFMKEYTKVGEHEGCGVLLLLAKLDVNGVGRIVEDEMKDFHIEVERMAESHLGFASTAMIVSTLSLSITVPLILFQNDDFDPSVSAYLGGGWPGGAASPRR